MTRLKFLFLLLISFLSISQLNAQFRKYSNEFLNIGAGARGLAMGGAQVASTKDATSGYWNPAGLVQVKENPSLSLMHAEYFSGIGKYDFGALAIPTKSGQSTLAISFLRFAVDDIPNTLFLVEPDGSINYNNVTSFSSADYAFLISYAKKLIDTDEKQLSFGGNAKVIYRQVGSFAKAVGFGIDLGVQYKVNNWQLAAVLRDATTTFNAWTFSFSEREKEMLYLTNNSIPLKSTENTAPRLVLGGAYTFQISEKFSLLAEANLQMTFDGKRNTLLSTSLVSVDPQIGLEANLNNAVFFRAGVSNFQRALRDADITNPSKVWIFQPSLGTGFRISNAAIDYAFTNLANQSNPLYTHIFSLKIDLVKKGR